MGYNTHVDFSSLDFSIDDDIDDERTDDDDADDDDDLCSQRSP
jgi:hypothetical protein